MKRKAGNFSEFEEFSIVSEAKAGKMIILRLMMLQRDDDTRYNFTLQSDVKNTTRGKSLGHSSEFTGKKQDKGGEIKNIVCRFLHNL